MDISPAENITEFIDLTILNTPKPQASSTVERKGVYRYRAEKSANFAPVGMDIPTRDTDTKSYSHRQSSVSSLGILSMDNVEELKELSLVRKENEDNTQKIERKSNINEALAMQRLLAQKAMERVDSKAKDNVAGIPSYLLKPTQAGINNTIHTATPTKNESTINLSDLERSLQPKSSGASHRISFNANEISARSSSFGNRTDQSSHVTASVDLRSPSPVRGLSSDLSAKYQNICEQLRQSDASLNAFCDRSSRMGMRTQPLGSLQQLDVDSVDLSSTSDSWINYQQDSLVAKLQNELFTPAELAGDKLLADELSWRREKDILPIESYGKKGNNHVDTSCFSGYVGDADISLSSRTNEKVSISEYFKRRSENVEDMNLKASPEKKHIPVALINLTNNTIQDNGLPEIVPENDCRMSTNSILSMTQIANILANMDVQDTPTRALNMLLKKSTQTSLINTPSTISTNSSTLKNTRVMQTLSPGSHTLKENSHTNIECTKSPRRSENEAILRDMTNIECVQSPRKSDNEAILRDMTNIECTKSPRRSDNEAKLRNMTNLHTVSSDGEWTDAKSNIVTSFDNNKTISSIAESRSYSCSELEFTDDERTSSSASRHTDEWLHIENSEVYKLYVNVNQNVPITLQSKTNHWLHVKVVSADLSENTIKINILNNEGLLKPFVTEQFYFKATSLVSGKFKVIFQVDVLNVVTRAHQILEHTVFIEAEEPEIKVLNDILDYKLNAEGSIKSQTLSLINESANSFKISLTIVQECEWVFVFGSDDESSADSNGETNHVVTVPAGGTVSVVVDMRSPHLEDLGVASGVDITTVTGTLHVQLIDSAKLLRQVQLTGCVGFTKVQFKTSCVPFRILPGETKQMQVRNSGVVPMELSVSVVASNKEPYIEDTDNVFTLNTTNLLIKPSQVGTVNVTFNAKDKLRPGKRWILLAYPRGPNFILQIEHPFDSRSPDIKLGVGSGVSPRRDRSGSSSSLNNGLVSAGSLHPLPEGKLPIESTRTELVWGCVRPGRTNTQDFVLRNRCSQRVRLQAVIHGSSAFKFMKEHSENTTSINLMLHALESRTLSVSFCPNSKGAAAGRMMFQPIEHDASYSKRQVIQLYGYGGHIAVDVQKVAKDTAGRMWLSFGRLDYRDTLHQTFILRNTGSLAAFTCLSVTCKVLYPFMDSSVTIFPSEAVIEPNKEIEISVNFSPRPEDFKYIQKTTAVEVSEIASIKIATGPEPTRCRIRRLFSKLNSSSTGIMTQLTNTFIVPRLSGVFPGECIPKDVSTCREGGGALRDLLRDIDTRELVLTIERGAADVTGAEGVLDNTLMFQSLVVVDNTGLSVTGRASGGFCSVEPRRLTITPAEQGVVVVRSHHSRPMPYEVCVPPAAAEVGLQASPLVGVLSPGDSATVTVFCRGMPPRLPFSGVFMIYVENEVMDIELKIQSIQRR